MNNCKVVDVGVKDAIRKRTAMGKEPSKYFDIRGITEDEADSLIKDIEKSGEIYFDGESADFRLSAIHKDQLIENIRNSVRR